MLIPVTHSTQCVAECAKCGFSGQANTTLVQPRSSVFHRPIQYGRPNYITHEPEFEPGSCVQRLFDTLANHRTHNTWPHCHFDWRMGIGCATLGMDQWETIFFLRRGYVRVRCITHVLTRGNGGIRTQTNFTSEKSAAIARAVKVLVMDVWL